MYEMVGPVSIKYIFTTRYIGLYITLFPSTILPYKFWVPVSVSIFHHLCTDLIYAVLVCDDYILSYLQIQIRPIRYRGLCL